MIQVGPALPAGTISVAGVGTGVVRARGRGVAVGRGVELGPGGEVGPGVVVGESQKQSESSGQEGVRQKPW
nr:MAG: hypothetical protein A2V48_04990 [Candidatus Amesbacteria bacterium RBG_19FT_COMBO_48_16]